MFYSSPYKYMMNVATKYKDSDVPKHYSRMYQYKDNKWVIVGYSCPECGSIYKGLRIELFRHENICKGRKPRSLED